MSSRRRTRAAKRVFDVVIAGSAIVVLSPLLLGLALVLRITQGSPILFRQQRPGLHGKAFTIYKFRTMVDTEPVEGEPDGVRVTRLGRRLRSLSLDELPELWNVLKGDMSIVGPRPLLMAYLERYTPEQARRHEVRPGITGLAQVSGRNAITWDQRFALDIEYVDEHDLRMDLDIIVRTVQTVLRREGINATSDDSMPEFLGSAASDAPDMPDTRVGPEGRER
jgi:lipopolysaccharide/colanic/teichoic acid biosynthesis glycosyltransferase